MKRIFRSINVLAVFVFLLISSACNKQHLSSDSLNTRDYNNNFSASTTLATPNPFNKSVGAPIDGALGDKWIANYKAKYGYNKSYTLNSKYLQSIVSQADCAGISLYYAIDNNSNTHILPIGVDINGKVMKKDYVSTMQGNISWSMAWQWISKHPGLVDAHFQGCNTYSRLNLATCNGIKVDFAIDDKNKPQLLLTNPEVLKAVKQYEDVSATCPPSCP